MRIKYSRVFQHFSRFISFSLSEVIIGQKQILGPVDVDTISSIRTLSETYSAQGLKFEVRMRYDVL